MISHRPPTQSIIDLAQKRTPGTTNNSTGLAGSLRLAELAKSNPEAFVKLSAPVYAAIRGVEPDTSLSKASTSSGNNMISPFAKFAADFSMFF